MLSRILPGVAISIFAGNVFYAWQAHRLARRTGRTDVTAIPFGVNTPTIFAYIFLIMVPVYQRTHDPSLTWQVGVFASFLSGAVQTAGAFCTDWMRKAVPRAALLCPLAGIALSFLCLGFIFGIFQVPAVALFPAIILLAVYSSRLRLPFRLPGGLLSLIVAAILVAVLHALHLYPIQPPPLASLGLHFPRPMNVLTFLRQAEGWKYLSIILPMSVLDTLVSLQILESVKVAGDDYPTRPSLLVNGVATIAAAAFGSPFPTTLYLGHSAFKALGARSGYSTLSGAVTMLICLTGLVPLVLHIVPLEAVSIVVVWVGLVMVGDSFSRCAEGARRRGCAWPGANARLVDPPARRPRHPQGRVNALHRRSRLRQRTLNLWPDRHQPGSAAGLDDLDRVARHDHRPPVPESRRMDGRRSRLFLPGIHPRLHPRARRRE